MFKTSIQTGLAVLSLVVVLGVPLFTPDHFDGSAWAVESGGQQTGVRSSKLDSTMPSLQQTSGKRKEIVSEAVATLRESQDALKDLDEGKNKEALAALERATGKLEIVLARDPKMALVPIAVNVTTRNIHGSLDDIKTARLEAERLLRDGHLQQARALLANLASESDIRTTNLPVATYPTALKKAAKLIDENKVAKAKEVIQTALDTLVITELVVPLPVVDAQVSLQKAEEIAKIQNRTTEQNQKLSALVLSADKSIKFAEALGYGTKDDFDSFHKQISEIQAKTANGKHGSEFFDQIKNYISSMNRNSQHKSDVGTSK